MELCWLVFIFSFAFVSLYAYHFLLSHLKYLPKCPSPMFHRRHPFPGVLKPSCSSLLWFCCRVLTFPSCVAFLQLCLFSLVSALLIRFLWLNWLWSTWSNPYGLTPVWILLSMAILKVPFQICSNTTCLLEENLKVPDNKKLNFPCTFKTLSQYINACIHKRFLNREFYTQIKFKPFFVLISWTVITMFFLLSNYS